MSAANKALAMRWIDSVTAGDVEAFRAAMAPEGTHEVPGTCFMSGVRTRDEAAQAIGLITSLTKNGLTLRVLSMIAEGGRVSAEAVGECELVSGDAYNNRYHFLFEISGERITSIKEFVDTKLVDDVLLPLRTAPSTT